MMIVPTTERAMKKKKKVSEEHDVKYRYCTCSWMAVDTDDESYIRVWHNPECPLHNDDPKHDLPESI